MPLIGYGVVLAGWRQEIPTAGASRRPEEGSIYIISAVVEIERAIRMCARIEDGEAVEYRFSVIATSKNKTDKADASALARFLKLDYLPGVPVPAERVRQLRHLLQARETLVGSTALQHNG